MEYVDGQLVGVRDRMASAKATEGESRSKVLQDVRIASFCSYLNWFANAPLVLDVQGKKTRLLQSRHLQFKVVHNKWNSILAGHRPSCRLDQSHDGV
jgi:hypothetical protein